MKCFTRTAAALGLLLGLPFSLSHIAHAQASLDVRQTKKQLRSKIYIYNIADGQSRLAFTDDSIWEAPNWSPDGKYLISNHNGTIYKLVFQTDGMLKPEKLQVSADLICNNDKSLSPDGKFLAFSASTPTSHGSEVFLAKADGSEAKQMTTEAPSYFHGWSPDGSTLAFVAYRHGSRHFNIYTIPTVGGSEIARTAVPYHNDGPDYSPDGQWMYINSDRSGKEAIWRFPAKVQGAPKSRGRDGVERCTGRLVPAHLTGRETPGVHRLSGGHPYTQLARAAGRAQADERDGWKDESKREDDCDNGRRPGFAQRELLGAGFAALRVCALRGSPVELVAQRSQRHCAQA